MVCIFDACNQKKERKWRECVGKKRGGNLLIVSRTNKDLDPVPRHNRKWGVTSFLAYWISDAFKYEHKTSRAIYAATDTFEALQHGNSLRVSSQLVPSPPALPLMVPTC